MDQLWDGYVMCDSYEMSYNSCIMLRDSCVMLCDSYGILCNSHVMLCHSWFKHSLFPRKRISQDTNMAFISLIQNVTFVEC